MATIEDLSEKSLSEMSVDEAIEHLRQIRLSRRTQKKPTKKASPRKKKKKESLTQKQAQDLLKILEG